MTTIQQRRICVINTDPQRRCYWGVNAKEQRVWSAWVDLETLQNHEDVEQRLKFWRELNDYVVSFRGKNSRCKYRIKPEPEED